MKSVGATCIMALEGPCDELRPSFGGVELEFLGFGDGVQLLAVCFLLLLKLCQRLGAFLLDINPLGTMVAMYNDSLALVYIPEASP